jgi:hypothetical protein
MSRLPRNITKLGKTSKMKITKDTAYMKKHGVSTFVGQGLVGPQVQFEAYFDPFDFFPYQIQQIRQLGRNFRLMEH